MNIREARATLEIPDTATPEEAKKKYRELTKKLHPDVNKAPDAEEKFKKINEAYQVISSGKGTDVDDKRRHYDPFDPFGQRSAFIRADNIEIKTIISFQESIFGCKKEFKFNRNTKCKNCDGKGEFALNNGCIKCSGNGQVVIKQGNMVFVQTCDKCYGEIKTESCGECAASGVVNVEATVTVSIPGGVLNGNVLKLNGMGNFAGNFGLMERYTDTHLHITVVQEPGLRLEGQDVVTGVDIPLLDALIGCSRTVKTIVGDKDIDIKPMSKNKDEIVLPNLGVNKIGSQRVIINVMYPDDVKSIVDALSLNKEN